jgi:hypothetical protein
VPQPDPTHADPPPVAAPVVREVIARRIEERLRRHLTSQAVDRIRDAVVEGQVVRVEDAAEPSVIAYKRGVLFVAGLEYVINDD